MANQDFSLLLSAFPKAASAEPQAAGGSVTDIINAAAEKEGLPPELLQRIAGVESGGKANAKNPNSSAEGLFQFIDSTWASMGGKPEEKKDPVKNAEFGAKYVKQNAEALTKSLGRNPTYGEIYAAHMFGSGVAPMLAEANPTERIEQGLARFESPERVKLILQQNPQLRGQTVGQVLSNFEKKMGGGATQQASSFSNVRPLATDRTATEAVTDNLLGAGAGIVTGAKLIADAFGANNPVSNTLEGASKALTDSQSQYRKDQRAERGIAIKQAEQSGSTWEEIKANVAGFAEAPLETTLNALGTSAPTLLMSVIPGLGQAQAARLILQGAMGATQGAGAAKGSIYEAVYNQLVQSGMSTDDASKAAAGAQAYDSQNGGMIAANAILGAVAGTSGIEAVTGRLAGRAGTQTSARGIAGRAGVGVAKESPVEGAQGGTERATSNVALQNQGFDVPTMQGVAGQAAGEALASAPGGAVFGALDRGAPAAPVANPLQPVIDQAQKPGSVLSRAAVAGNQGAIEQQAEVAPEVAAASADPISGRVAAAEQVIRDAGVLEKLRGLGPQIGAENLTNDFLYALQVARNPNSRPDQRQAAIEQVEQAIQWTETGFTPGAAPVRQQPGTAVAVRPENAVGPVGQAQFFDPNVIDVDSVRVDNMLPGPRALPGPRPLLQGPADTEQSAPNAAEVSAPAEQQTVAPQTETIKNPEGQKTPAGAGTAAYRRRSQTIQQLVDQGYETVERRDGEGFFLKNSKTGAEIKLDGMADAALARNLIQKSIRAQADQSPNSPRNDLPESTEGQNKAGNYKKPPVSLNGFTIRVENPAGSVRRGVDKDGVAWESEMKSDYGYIENTKAKDGDGVDVVIGNRSDSGKIFVIDQVNEDGSFDEPKVVMGVTDEDHARRTYLSNYEPGWQGLGAITEMTREQFNDWLKSGGPMKATALGKKPAAQKPAAQPATSPAPQEQPAVDQKARWIKAITDENRSATDAGVQLDVTPDGKLTFLGDPNATQQGRRLLATLAEARKAGATDAEIAEAVKAKRDLKYPGGKRQGSFDTLEEAKQYLSQQRRANGSVSGLPLQLSDGSFTVAAKGTPQYAEAERQRDQRERSGKQIEQGDFFTVKDGGKPKKLKRVKKAELPKKASSARRLGEPRALTQDEASLIEQIASVLGKRVVFFEAQDGRIGDGFFDPSQPDVLFVASETTVNPLAVFGHEFFHDLRETNPEAWNAIAAVVRTRVADPKGFRADYYGDTKAEQRGNAALSEEKGGELEELVSDLGGNLMMDATFWRDVFAKIREDNGGDAKGIIARLAAALEQFVARVVNAMKQGGFRADDFVTDLGDVRKAYRDGLADYIKAAGLRQASMAAEIKRAEQDIKKSTDKSDKGLTIEGYHFSQQPRAVLTTGMFGTGLKGSARDEIMNADDARLRQRLYFYVNKGTGINPEAGVGAYAHKATLTNIYDADADPLRLRSGNARAFESKVLDSGFSGYLSRLEGTQSGQVILLGSQTIKPQLLGAGKVTGAKAVPAPQQREQDLADRLMANKALPSGMLSPQRWSEVLMAQDPELAAQLLDIGAFEGGGGMYKDELAGKVRQLGADIRKSADRAAKEYADVEAKYKGTDQWMKALDGTATKLSERQWVQVRTPSFKKWFGDWEQAFKDGGVWSTSLDVSKAVGENGEPLVVYHGTDKGGFTEFEQPGGTGRGDLGIWTTSDYGMARSYVRKGRARDVDLTAPTQSELEEMDYEFNEDDGGVTVIDPNGYTIDGPADNDFKFRSVEDAVAAAIAELSGEAGTQPGIYALFINVRNPNEDNFEGAMWNGERIDQYQVRDENDEPVRDENGRGYFDIDTANALAEANPGAEVQPADPHYNTTDDVVSEARRHKNDGAIIREVVDNGGGPGYDMEPSDIFVAFDPSQAKSADYNNGEFSDSTGDLRKSPPRKAAKRPAQDPAIGDKTDVSKLPEGKVIPPEVAVGSLEGSLKIAGSKSYRRGRDLKKDIQDRVLEAARAARVNLSLRTKSAFRFLADMAIADAKFALKSNENAVGWYDSKVSRAIGALSTVHPEIETDPRSRLAFLWALAVTSNGLKVNDNFRLAERAYREWKSTGRMPTDIGIGNAAGAINKGMAQYNGLIEKLDGDSERLLKFMSTKFTAGEIEGMLGTKANGEWMGTPVRGAAILGPKIGNGFFSNLNGYFDALTMDRWLMRTWGRMTGTLLVEDVKAIDKARGKLVSAINAMSPEQRRQMSKVIGKPVTKGMTRAELAEVAKAAEKASMRPEKREAMQVSPETDRFRLDARGLHKAIDGQKEAPDGPAERNWIRAVFQDSLEKLQADGLDMTMSDLQALLWYPERRLYDAAKADDEIEAGYEDDEAPDYANAAFDLAINNGVNKIRVLAAMDAAEARGTVVGKPFTDAEKKAMLDQFRKPPGQQNQIAFEVAPSPDNEAATAEWNRLSDKDKREITELAKGAVLADLADALGLKIGKGVMALGGYEGQINPNIIAEYKVTQVSVEDARALAAAIGIALEQKSVVLTDKRSSKTNGLIRIELSGRAEKHAGKIMAAISEELPGVTDFTARGNNLDILNFTGGSTEELAGKIDQVLAGLEVDVEYTVAFGDVNSELVTEGEYEGQILGSRPESGREVLERARRARARAREIVGAELRSRSPGQVQDGAGSARRGAAEGGIRGSAPRNGSGRQKAGRAASGSLEASEQAAAQALKPLPGAPTVQGATGPDPKLVAVAERYARDNGIQLRRQAEYVKADPQRGKRIADAYAAMAHDPQNPRVKEAYQNLIKQTRAQYDALVDAGYKFWFMDMNLADNQEYASSPWNAMRDLRANQEMGVFPTSDGFGTSEEFTPDSNPLLEDTGLRWPIGNANSNRTAPVLANDLFRAVHDAFGHGLEGAGFRADGEENAWQAHVRLFTGSAVAAITSETRGQNSWLNFGPNGETNRTAKVEDTVFADQKTGLMPEWTWKEGVVGDMPADANTSYNQRVAALKDLIACLKK